MKRLFYIQGSVFGGNGQSSQLAERYIKHWKELNQQGEVVVRDLISEPVPHLDSERAGAFFTPQEQRTEKQQVIIDYSDQLIDEIRQADEIVLGLPLYNFGVPSQMKAYFDHLSRVGVTFTYTDKGPVGLLEDKPVQVFATRGGLYRDTGMDNQVPFVRQFLGFIGLQSVEIIYAEGLNREGLKDPSLEQAHNQIDQLFTTSE